jgi:hypothetical protein
MSKKRTNNPTPAEMEKAFSEDAKFRSYKNDGKGFDEFNEGDEIVGVLLSIRDHQITDQRTGDPKDLRVYTIRTDSGTKRIGGRTILDRMFDEIMDENGGFLVENRRYTGKGYDYLQNRLIKLNRGEDTKTRNKNPLGTYEIGLEED